MNDFKYSSEKINKLIDESGCKKATMKGVYNDLQKIKPLIEEFYDKYIFYLDYWTCESGFHGWEYSEKTESMHKITGGITDKFQEIYALILAGLGERCEKQGGQQ